MNAAIKTLVKGLEQAILTRGETEIVNMYMRRCLTSLVIKEIQIKAATRNLFFPHLSNWQNFQCRHGEVVTLVPCRWDNRSVRTYISGRHLETLGKP